MLFGDKWNDWFIFDEKRLTVHGNMVSPGNLKVIEWLGEIWNEFDQSTMLTFSPTRSMIHPSE